MGNKVTIRDRNFSKGIDQRSAESELKEGYCEDLVNVDIVQGRLRKRKGFEIFGELPLRVVSASVTAGAYSLTLDSNIDISGITSRPILVRGLLFTTSPGSTEFSSNSSEQWIDSPVFDSSTNVITFTLGSDTIASTTDCNLAVYGLSHNEVYSPSAPAGSGVVTHLDSYTDKDGDSYLIAGLGGTFYKAVSTSVATTVNFSATCIGSEQVISPKIFETGVTTGASSNGWLTHTDGDSHTAKIVSVTYGGTSGGSYYSTYRLYVPNYSLEGGASTLEDVFEPEVDWFHIDQLQHSDLEGTLKVKSVAAVDADYIDVTLWNNSVVDDRYDETSSLGGVATSMSDSFDTASSNLAVGDTVSHTKDGETASLEVTKVSGSTLTVVGLLSPITFSSGYLVSIVNTEIDSVLRTTDTLTLSAAEEFVQGDVVSLGTYSRSFQIASVSTDGQTITLNEEVSVGDLYYVGVTRRFVALEVPSTSFTSLTDCKPQLLDENAYTAQAAISSASVAGNLYFVNGYDHSYKFDGEYVYRAGLPSHLQSTSSFFFRMNVGDPISPENPSLAVGDMTNGTPIVSFTGASGYKLPQNVDLFREGDYVRINNDSTSADILNAGYQFRYRVIGKNRSSLLNSTDDVVETGELILDRTRVSSATNGQVWKSSPLIYYNRFRCVDRNDNIIVSAPYDSGILRQYSYYKSNVNFSLCGFYYPGIYDFDRINQEVFRNKGGSTTDFYRVSSTDINKDSSSRTYVTDYLDDSALTELDSVSAALKGTELGTGWSPPPIAKYATSIDNRLVLANIKTSPSISLSYFTDKSTTFTTIANIGSGLIIKESSNSENYPDFTTSGERTLVAETSNNTFTISTFISQDWSSPFYTSLGVYTATNPLSVVGDIVQSYCANHGAGSEQGEDWEPFLFGYSQVKTSSFDLTAGSVSAWASGTSYSVGDLVADGTNTYIYRCFKAGTSDSSEPTFTNKSLGLTTDNTVIWAYAGLVTDVPSISIWTTGSKSLGTIVTDTGSSNAYICTTVGTSGGGEPSWNTTVGATTTDGTVTWTRIGNYYTKLSANIPSSFYSWYNVTTTTLSQITLLTRYQSTSVYPGTIPVRQLPGSILDDYSYFNLSNNTLINTIGDRIQTNLLWFINGINETISRIDKTLLGQEDFTPWVTASGGPDFPLGQLNLTGLSPSTEIVVRPRYENQCKLFVDGKRVTLNTDYTSSNKTMSSRIVVSYENYPEIFDSPFTQDPNESDSVIDVNSADGQVLTGVLPFFGTSAFKGASTDGVLVAFKEYSIYLASLQEKANNTGNYLQKLETNGLGCTAPRSIAYSKKAIFFANETGVFALRRDLTIQYVGEPLERFWQEEVNTSVSGLSKMRGHCDRAGNRYVLSVPLGTDTENSVELVYHFAEEKEGDSLGAWTRYTGLTSNGWCNSGQYSFLCNYSGQVFVSRNTGEASDYRDDVYSSDLGCSEPTAISSVITFRALDFGDSGIRKLVRKVIGHYRAASGTVEEVSLQYANDLKTVFQDTTDFTLFTYNKDNLSDYGYKKVESVAHSIGEQRSQYLQLKLTADGLDESVDFVGFDYQVEGLSSSGIPQAADT